MIAMSPAVTSRIVASVLSWSGIRNVVERDTCRDQDDAEDASHLRLPQTKFLLLGFEGLS